MLMGKKSGPWVTRGGARTKSAINNTQASGYVRACVAPESRRSNFHGWRFEYTVRRQSLAKFSRLQLEE